jgi:hypothetical protein
MVACSQHTCDPIAKLVSLSWSISNRLLYVTIIHLVATLKATAICGGTVAGVGAAEGEMVRLLCDMGFSSTAARRQLEQSGWDVEAATDALLTGGGGGLAAPAPTYSSAPPRSSKVTSMADSGYTVSNSRKGKHGGGGGRGGGGGGGGEAFHIQPETRTN